MLHQLSNKSAILCWIFATVALIAMAVTRWPHGEWLKTDFYALLPENSKNPWLTQANSAAAFTYESQLILLIQGQDRSKVDRFLESASETLRSEGYVDSSFEESEAEKWRTLSERLYPYRWVLLSSRDREALQQGAEAHLEQFRSLLYTPLGGIAAASLESDPAGLFRRYLEAAMPSVDAVHVAISVGEQVTELAIFSVLPNKLGTGTMASLYTTYLTLKSEAEASGVTLHVSGAQLYSAYGASSAKLEMSTIGLASLMALVVLLVVSLRSKIAIFMTLLCVSSSVIGGLLITVSLLQEIHILTLVFGATIIGISADYSFHYLSHSIAAGPDRGNVLGKVLPAMSLGALSSILAFIGLTLLPFPGIRQIGLFMSTGLFCSFLTVCLLFPAMIRGSAETSKIILLPSERCLTPLTGLLLFITLIVMAVPGLFMLQARDELRDFYATPELLEEDQAEILNALSISPDSRYLLVRAPTIEELLEAEEKLIQSASVFVRSGQLGGLSGVSTLLPSAATQRKNFAVMQDLVGGGYFSTHLDALGFDFDGRERLLAELPRAYQVLDMDVLENLVLPVGTGGFLGCEAGECASWVRISGPVSTRVLADLVSHNHAVSLVNPIEDINEQLTRYRVGVGTVLVVGVAVITLLLFIICGWQLALQIILLPVTACLLSLAATGYISGSYTIVNFLAMLLIIGVSLDYAIFRVFTASADRPVTSLAITLSALTSILAFGMLAFSKTPVISSFGQTIAFGLVFAYGLSWFRFERKS
jgi:predicted exporter